MVALVTWPLLVCATAYRCVVGLFYSLHRHLPTRWPLGHLLNHNVQDVGAEGEGPRVLLMAFIAGHRATDTIEQTGSLVQLDVGQLADEWQSYSLRAVVLSLSAHPFDGQSDIQRLE